MCPFSWAIFAIVAIGNNRKNCPWGSGAVSLTRLTGKFREAVSLLSSNARGKSGLDREGLPTGEKPIKKNSQNLSPFVRFSAQTLGVKSGLDREGLPS